MMKIAVVTLIFGANYKEAVRDGIENKRLYCQKYGYDFICGEENLDPSRPIAWSKILLIQKVMKNPSYEWIFWTDADSLIMNFNIRLESLIDENFNFIISKDINNINSGEFFIKNTEWSDTFLTSVYSRTECIDHIWWENQAIILELEQKPEYASRTKIVPQKLFNSSAYEVIRSFRSDALYRKGDFIVHFAGLHKFKALKFLMYRYSRKPLGISYIPRPQFLWQHARLLILLLLQPLRLFLKRSIF